MVGSIIKLAVKGFGKALKKKNPKLKRIKKGILKIKKVNWLLTEIIIREKEYLISHLLQINH